MCRASFDLPTRPPDEVEADRSGTVWSSTPAVVTTTRCATDAQQSRSSAADDDEADLGTMVRAGRRGTWRSRTSYKAMPPPASAPAIGAASQEQSGESDGSGAWARSRVEGWVSKESGPTSVADLRAWAWTSDCGG